MYFAMVNLIAGKQVVPELIQDNFTTQNVVREVELLLHLPPRRKTKCAVNLPSSESASGRPVRLTAPPTSSLARSLGELNEASPPRR